MSRMTIDTLAALFAVSQQDRAEQHKANQDTLGQILVEVKATNGRVSDHEMRLRLIEMKPDRRHPVVASEEEPRDWKVLGTGIGAVVLAAWGAVEVLRLCLGFIAKVGGAVVGK